VISSRVRLNLRAHLAAQDPWSLNTNPYEQIRYGLMLELIRAKEGVYESGLEIGCAAGSFTFRLLKLCKKLHVVDCEAPAIEKCRQRLGNTSEVRFSVADISECGAWSDSYDLIVVSEILYYLETAERVAATVKTIATWLSLGGVLIFGSVSDAIASRWGWPGAESTIPELSKYLREVDRRTCNGLAPFEHAIIVKFVRDKTCE
jgi:2-polyprenyl-3-methyl-5-hydroxy-6-metoxy-1,4-benzoquinol methylase